MVQRLVRVVLVCFIYTYKYIVFAACLLGRVENLGREMISCVWFGWLFVEQTELCLEALWLDREPLSEPIDGLWLFESVLCVLLVDSGDSDIVVRRGAVCEKYRDLLKTWLRLKVFVDFSL